MILKNFIPFLKIFHVTSTTNFLIMNLNIKLISIVILLINIDESSSQGCNLGQIISAVGNILGGGTGGGGGGDGTGAAAPLQAMRRRFAGQRGQRQRGNNGQQGMQGMRLNRRMNFRRRRPNDGSSSQSN